MVIGLGVLSNGIYAEENILSETDKKMLETAFFIPSSQELFDSLKR